MVLPGTVQPSMLIEVYSSKLNFIVMEYCSHVITWSRPTTRICLGEPSKTTKGYLIGVSVEIRIGHLRDTYQQLVRWASPLLQMCPCIPVSTLVLVRSMFSFLCSRQRKFWWMSLKFTLYTLLVRPLSTRVGFLHSCKELLIMWDRRWCCS